MYFGHKFCKRVNGPSQIKRLYPAGLVAAWVCSLGLTDVAEAAPSTSRTLEASFKNPPGLGAPEKIILDDLESWSRHDYDGVKYFSGSATYRKEINLASLAKSENLKSKMVLDLGKIAVMAEVKLNGKNLGILWKAPYRMDITDSVKAGKNDLEIRVVNLPVNRMIGDEFLPEDSERNKNGTLRH